MNHRVAISVLSVVLLVTISTPWGDDPRTVLQSVEKDPFEVLKPLPSAPTPAPDTSDCSDETCCPDGLFQIIGTAGNDSLQGHPGGQCIVGLAGHDNLDGISGNDFLVGGPGMDRLIGRSGNEILHGGEDNDQLVPGSGNDHAWGGPGDDLIVAYSGENLLGGGEGDDEIHGGAHADTIWGDQGDDLINAHTGHDTIYPGPGLDTVLGGPGNDTIVILSACELVEGETIDGGPGFDRVEIPFFEAQLLALGVSLLSIEEVVFAPSELDVGPGHCLENNQGEIVCQCCDEGTVENQCGLCGPGYHAVGPRGIPGELDVPGRFFDADFSEWVCQPNRTCEDFDCGDHGICTDEAGTPTCICDLGYTSALCRECVAGFTEVMEEVCEPSADCGEQFCNGHGECIVDEENRALVCDCDQGFEGPNCGPRDLSIALAKPAVESQEVKLTAELGPGVDCAGDFDWEVVGGSGEVVVDNEDSSIARYTPDALTPGDLTRADVVRATCQTEQALSFDLGISVVELDGLPINGLARPELVGIDEAMLQFLDDRGMPGATLAITKDDELVFLRGYGWFNEQMTKTMPTCAPMRTASVTKPFTRAGVRNLYDTDLGGGVTLQDETIVEPLFFSLLGIDPNTRQPDYVIPADEYDLDNWPTTASGCQVPNTGQADIGWGSVRIKDLRRHRSGILSNDSTQQPGLFDPQFNDITLANMMGLNDAPPGIFDRLRFLGGACFIDYIPNSHYSNVGYNLLGRIGVQVSGASAYAEFLQEIVLDPAGIVGGTDPDTTDLIYLGRSLVTDVQPEEPDYFTERADRGNVVLAFLNNDDEWEAGGDVPAPYGGFHLEAMDAHGGIVSKAETLTDFMRAYKISNGKTRALGEFSLDGMGAHYGSLTGSHSYFWQLPHSDGGLNDMGNPIIVLRQFKIPGSAPLLEDLDVVVATLPVGVTVAVLFNKEEPRDDDDYPNYVSGTHDLTLLSDVLGLAISQVSDWPIGLTQEQKDLGCVQPLPPPDNCGNGEVDPGEECDGGPGNFTCQTVGDFSGGDLECDDDCLFDTSGCLEVPDNGLCDPDEDGPGDCPGAICAEIDLSADPVDPFSAFRGDGDFDGLQYCKDDTGWGRMVCIQEGNNVSGICKVCGPFQEESLSTKIGCPCVFDEGGDGCNDLDLACWGGIGGEMNAGWDNANVDSAPGYCYDINDGPPAFQCLANCPLLGYDEVNEGPYFCYTGSPQDPSGPKGLCLSFFCPGWFEEQQADECAVHGGICDEDGFQTCVAECDIGDPTPCQDAGYPDSWVCLEQGNFGGRCVFFP